MLYRCFISILVLVLCRGLSPAVRQKSVRSKQKQEKLLKSLIELTEDIKEKTFPQSILPSTRRYWMLSDLMRDDYESYLEVAGNLHLFHDVKRTELPNVVDIPISIKEHSLDCVLPNVTYSETPLDWLLLTLTRKYYYDFAPYEISKSKEKGIRALLNEMVQLVEAGASNEEQKDLVVNTLRALMTSYLPPFYRFFVTGKPWANFATSIVAPYVFGYLVGPSTPNRLQANGKRGGLLVHKCKFLQESNCKGLCLHQCKLPAETLFAQDLGVKLYVQPNFITQECQWSWGVDTVPSVDADPYWPKGCISSCPTQDLELSRAAGQEKKKKGQPSFCSPT